MDFILILHLVLNLISVTVINLILLSGFHIISRLDPTKNDLKNLHIYFNQISFVTFDQGPDSQTILRPFLT